VTGRPIVPKSADWRPGDQRVFVADIGKIQRALGWAPKTMPQDGILRLVEWANGHLALLRQVAGVVIQ